MSKLIVIIFTTSVFCVLMGQIFYSVKKSVVLRKMEDFEQLNTLVNKLFRRGWNGIVVGVGFFIFWFFLYYGFPVYRVSTYEFLNFLLLWAFLLILVGAVDLIISYQFKKKLTTIRENSDVKGMSINK